MNVLVIACRVCQKWIEAQTYRPSGIFVGCCTKCQLKESIGKIMLDNGA